MEKDALEALDGRTARRFPRKALASAPSLYSAPVNDASAPPMPDLDRASISRDLANAVEGEVRFGLHDRMLYATDASLYQVEPLGVVIPSDVEDAARAVRFCGERGLPILPRGGGTSLAGQCVNRAVVIDLSARCRAMGEVDSAARLISVEPGVYVEELNNELTRRGTKLFFAPDPATVRQATIGGCIGNNAAGARSILYGRTSENLHSVDAMLATGERVRLGPNFGRDGRPGENNAAQAECVRDLTERVAAVVQRLAPLIRSRWPKTVRRNAGYSLDLVLQMLEGTGAYASGGRRGVENVNLAHLVAGSEGTLAVTLGATLKLQPTPAAKGLAVIAFASLDEAIEAVVPILATHPSAVELLDDMVIGLARENLTARKQVALLPTLPGRPPEAVNAALYVEYFASRDASELLEKFAALEALMRSRTSSGGGTEVAFAMRAITDPAQMLQVWRLRQAGEPLLHGMPGERKPITFIEDNAIPPERLAEFVRRLRKIVEAHGTRAAFWAHASVGVLHVRPLVSTRDPEDLVRLREIAVQAADLARELGGVMSGEHGDGRVRGPLLERFYGREVCEGFAEVKRIFDPRGLLNPGMIVGAAEVESITATLRVDPAPATAPHTPARVPEIVTYFEYKDQDGFGHAVEMCNGAGVCRKRQGGTMCPSYMALQDERHATRGRANALRLAITGQLHEANGDSSRKPPLSESSSEVADAPAHTQPAWNDRETLETLDLCLSCKACKAECPSNVDVARLKSEYLAQGYKARGGAPWRAKIMANIRALNALGSRTPGLANWVNALAPVRALIGRIMDVHPKRSLPEFGESLFAWHTRHKRAMLGSSSPTPGSPSPPRVVLFADCFCAYNEPHIGRAAIRLLEAFGYDVILPRTGCCARPAISMGLLASAIEQADATLAALAPCIDDESCKAILVLEPSCLSAFKDDWLDLRLSTPLERRKQLAAKSWLVEEFLEREWDAHPSRPTRATSGASSNAAASGGAPNPMLLHAHCHQKALWGAESSAALLRRASGGALPTPDTGCCGMAGSFGYSRGRFDLSNQIGELTVFPAVRAAAGATVVAPGTSCRHQLKDALGVRALHPVEAAAKAWLPPEAIGEI